MPGPVPFHCDRTPYTPTVVEGVLNRMFVCGLGLIFVFAASGAAATSKGAPLWLIWIVLFAGFIGLVLMVLPLAAATIPPCARLIYRLDRVIETRAAHRRPQQ